MNFLKLFSNWLIVKVLDDSLPGNIILPENRFKRSLRTGKYAMGIVIQTGESVSEIKEGDYVVFNEYSVMGADDPRGLKIDQEHLIRESEIRVKFNERPKSVYKDTKGIIKVKF